MIATVFAPVLSDHPDCDRARVWAGKACAAKAPEGCAIADACQLQRKELHSTAEGALRSACERRSPLACLYWADAQGSQPDGTEGADRVRAAYVNACNKNGPGQGVACVRIAVADLARAKSAIDADRPLDFLRHACERSSAQACCELATEYDRGRWVPADPVKVTEFRRKACDLGAQICCGAKART
jgi:TPR repeat protein